MVLEARMSQTPQDDDALLDRLRAELARAEEDLRQATTPESKRQTVDRLRKALADFSCQVGRKRDRSRGLSSSA